MNEKKSTEKSKPKRNLCDRQIERKNKNKKKENLTGISV